ncbi:hypothetical protein ACF05L_01625 [Streptomyces bobili]|uniref:hypothetical protein n=1 Tax=Streptomyces bobili TaxID=67280 RepID=UPI0036FD5713
MAIPTVARQTSVRTTTVAVLTAGLLIFGVPSAQAAEAPALGSLIPQVNNILSGILSGNALSTLLPDGILDG